MDKTMQYLLRAVSNKESEEIYDCLFNQYSSIMRGKAFTSLKSFKGIFGGISRCDSFHPLGVYISGWYLPVNNYDSVEIYSGNKFLGSANLRLEREDVYKNFSFYNEKNAGFDIFITSNLERIDAEHPLTIIVKKQGKIVKKQLHNISVYSEDTSLREIGAAIKCDKRTVLVPTLTNKIPMILKIAEKMPEYQFITLMEGMENNLEAVHKTCQREYQLLLSDLNCLQMFMVPRLFVRNYFPGNSECVLNNEEKQLYEQEYVIRVASDNLIAKYHLTEEYAVKYCCVAYKYIKKLLVISAPKCLMLWNKYSSFHLIYDALCKKEGIPVIYMESGLLPGTLIFETEGQMGESFPAVHSDEFSKLEVTEEELKEAERLKEKLYLNKLNRWITADPTVYNKTDKQRVEELLKPGKPVVLYLGQNDYDSGMIPYTEKTKAYHSPIFESSNEAALFLGRLAEKNDWNFVYKRHPMNRGKMDIELPESVILNDTIDIHDAIDIADVVITILSQSSYVAMIRNKPAVMLGYHQLAHKDCVYEAWNKRTIEESIISAIEKGISEKQKYNFVKHIAQLCKYYLYTDFCDDTVSYGKSLNDLIHYIKDIMLKHETSSCDIFIGETEEDSHTVIEAPLSVFTLDLSIKERIKRRKILYMIEKKDFWHSGMNRGSISRFLMRNLTDTVFFENMMYVSQIDEEDLKKGGWEKEFTQMFFMALDKGEEYLANYLQRCKKLHNEIKRRLCIEQIIDKSFLQTMNMPYTAKQIIDICAKGTDEYLVKVCFETLSKALRGVEREKEQLVILIEKACCDRVVNDRRKSSLYELMFQCGVFTQNHMKQWMQILLHSTDKEVLNYYGGMEIAWIGYLQPEMIYPEYYIERRELLCHISKIMGGEYKKNAGKEADNKRVAFLVSGLHAKEIASTRLEIGLANELSKRGYEVTIFVADTQYIKSDDYFEVMPIAKRRNFSSIFKNQHLSMKENYVEIRYFEEKGTAEERYHAYISAIYKYNPKAIIDITNDNAIYNPQLLNDFPIFSIPLNGYSSSACSTAYIARDIELAKICNKEYHSLDIDKCYEANLYLPWEIGQETYQRSKYGLKSNDFIIVTVGNRLEYELTEDIQKGMKELLCCNRNIKWILVGRVNEKFALLKEEEIKGQVIYWGYEKNLPALYKICDVYLNPPRSGGAGSVACAVQVGIPAVVEDSPSDILPFIGIENAVGNWNEELKRILELYKNKVFQKKLWKKQVKNLQSEKLNSKFFGDVLEQAFRDVK